VNLSLGDHDLTKPAKAWTVRSVPGAFPEVELIASLLSHPTTPMAPTRGQTATTLAIRMDSQAAMNLYTQLGELGQKMGWLPQIEDEPQV
jgi:hypothetical protein